MEAEFKKTPRSGQAVLAVLEGYPKTRGPGASGVPPVIDNSSGAIQVPQLSADGSMVMSSAPRVVPNLMPNKKGHLPKGATILPKAPGSVVPSTLHPAMLATVQNAGVIPQGAAVPPVAPAVLAAATPTALVPGLVDGAVSMAETLDPVTAAYLSSVVASADGKLQPIIPEHIAGGPSPILAAMMAPVAEGLLPGCDLRVTAMELLQLAVADPAGAATVVNTMMGAGTCDATTVQPKAMQITMHQAYTFASKLAKNMGYHSLEHYELHKQALIRATGTKKRFSGEKRLTLFIGGLKKETSDETMFNHFRQYGEITRCDIIRNSDGTSRGFGFVKYKTEEEIQKAVRAKFDHILDGQWVNVKVSDPNRAETGKNASKAVEMAAHAAGVAPEHYMDYLQELAQNKYGYNADTLDNDSRDRSAPY